MNTGKKIVVGLITLLGVNFFVKLVANFMDIDEAIYMHYLIWFSALVVFWMILPSRVGMMFAPSLPAEENKIADTATTVADFATGLIRTGLI